jgi:hypothetical protein
LFGEAPDKAPDLASHNVLNWTIKNENSALLNVALEPLYIHQKSSSTSSDLQTYLVNQLEPQTSVVDAGRILVTLCKGYYCGHLGLPSGQPPDTPRTSVGHVPPARARSI